jgi:kinetochore protein Spc25, fungi type
LYGPELAWWETYLGLRFEGAGDESLVKVVYLFPAKAGGAKSGAAADGTREAVFELKVPDSGSQPYEVVGVKPKLDGDRVDKVVRRLNETREIGVLLKGMRVLFAEEMK